MDKFFNEITRALATRRLDELLFELTATDLFAHASETALRILASALAVFLRARRATQVDVTDVLRSE